MLIEMLKYKRPGGGETEEAFIKKFLMKLKGATKDAFGNVWVTVGESATLFTAHTDTVHRSEGKQKVKVKDGIITTPDGECLGADDGAGVWLLVQMVKAGVPGTYAFFREEESGGHGSVWANENMDLTRFKRAVAFDRRGVDSVITHQFGGRCCSDDFAAALAFDLNALLGDHGFFSPDDTGIFTDTANLGQIPNRTNISVGYECEHGASESLDAVFLGRLRDACLALDWEALPDVPYTLELPMPMAMPMPMARQWLDDIDLERDSYDEVVDWVANSYPEDVADAIWNVLRRVDK